MIIIEYIISEIQDASIFGPQMASSQSTFRRRQESFWTSKLDNYMIDCRMNLNRAPSEPP